ncbi:DUF3619 family protein [Undibacterium sp. Ren11W]|uniref:DUF3619 family protein n=1 Tax=Undibacterium sp. Ren11W TaxID=3413045 RepID=UPI003BF44F6D
MNYLKDTNELEFAYKVRRALNESAENIPGSTLERLAEARRIALTRKKQAAPVAVRSVSGVLAGNSGFSFQGPNSLLGKFGVALPLLVLILGLFGIYQYEQQQRIADLAEIDVAMLVDELPPDAYLDTGFRAFLNKTEE